MQAIDHIHLVFRKDTPLQFNRKSLALFSGLDDLEVEAVICSGNATPAQVTAGHLNACRAVTFGLDAGLGFDAALETVEASTLSDDEYRRCVVSIAGKAKPDLVVSRGVEFLEAVEAIAAAGRYCGMAPPRSLAA